MVHVCFSCAAPVPRASRLLGVRASVGAGLTAREGLRQEPGQAWEQESYLRPQGGKGSRRGTTALRGARR